MKVLVEMLFYNWGITLEVKLQDFWIGIYWDNRPNGIDIWICIIPCFPIHYRSGYPKSELEPKQGEDGK